MNTLTENPALGVAVVVAAAVVFFLPTNGRSLWWFQRHVPWLLAPVWRMTVRPWRTLCLEVPVQLDPPLLDLHEASSPD